MSIMDVLADLSDPDYDDMPLNLDSDLTPLTEADLNPAPQPSAPEPPAVPAEAYADLAALPPKKKKRRRPEFYMAIAALLAAMLLAAAVAVSYPYLTAPEEDPESLIQAQPVETVPVETYLEPTVPETQPENPTIPPDRNPYDRFDFQYDRNNYLKLQNLTSYAGVDVSAHQGYIDWEKVKASGIDFAIVRLGYRGYESGKLVEDKYAVKNLEGARDAGLRVGAYFFSQALNIKEVDQEIDFMLEILGERYLDMPIVLDWEIPSNSARTRDMDGRTLTDMQLHFCQTMQDKGYQPMVYFNWHQSENMYVLHELEDYPFWLALYQDRMTYPWEVEMWQWTQTGRVPGIAGNVDINVYMP